MNSETGYNLSTYQTTLNDLLEKIEQNFGSIQVKTGSALGTLMGIFAEIFVVYDNDLAYSISQTNVLSAESFYLDQFAFMMGIERKLNTSSFTFLTITSDVDRIINVPTGTEFLDVVTNEVWISFYPTRIDNQADIVTLQIQSKNTGAISAQPNNIIRILSTFIDSDQLTITNPTIPTLGFDKESDSNFRERIVEVASVRTIGMVQGLIVSLKALDGVSAVRVYNNIESTTDKYNIPPKSFEVVIFGGYDYDIVKIIFENQAITSKSYGVNRLDYYDIVTDETYSISFTRAVDIPIFIKATAKINNNFTTSSEKTATASMVTFINKLNIGETVLNDLVVGACYYDENNNKNPILGFDDISIELSSDGTNYTSGNIVIDYRAIPKTISTHVTFEFVVND